MRRWTSLLTTVSWVVAAMAFGRRLPPITLLIRTPRTAFLQLSSVVDTHQWGTDYYCVRNAALLQAVKLTCRVLSSIRLL